MKNQTKLLILATFTLTFSLVTMGTVAAITQLTTQSKVAINGIGAVKVGMNVPQAAQAANTKLVVEYFPDSYSCYYLQAEGKLEGVGLMVTDNRISRIDIDNPKITTISGAKVGDTEQKIKSLYPGQIQVTRHKYLLSGHYLTLIPKDPADKNFRVIFETDGKKVIRYRAGKLPEVEYVERCL
jgi:hypothetical protein